MTADDDRHFVANRTELGPGERILVELAGIEIAVFNVNGRLHALSNYCVHQGGPICEGLVSGALDADDDFALVYGMHDQVVSCPWHGWEFDISTGRHLANTGHRIPTFPVEVEDDRIYVRL